jgi:hypothetical protein
MFRLILFVVGETLSMHAKRIGSLIDPTFEVVYKLMRSLPSEVRFFLMTIHIS